MTRDETSEAVAVLQVALDALQAAVPHRTGRVGAAFRYACADLLARAPALIPAAALGAPLRSCFDQAVSAGATLAGFVGLRQALWAVPVAGQAAVTVSGSCYCHALSAEVRILSTASFASSGTALQALAFVSAAIGMAQDWALDSHLSAQYQALLALGAAVTRDLQARAAQLPRIVAYSFPRGASSLVLAYRLYGDANRADELRAENGAVHPAFCPASGTALSE